MKKHFLAIAALAVSVALNAQYTQTLPLDYNDFFRAEAIAEDGAHLERGEYEVGENQSPDGIKSDQWNLTGKDGSRGIDNPAIEDNTMSWNNYIDNNKGKAIIYDGTKDGTRVSIYSIIYGNTYSSADGSKSYYLSALIDFSKINSSGGADFISFDGNYTSTTARARVAVKRAQISVDGNNKNIGYCLGMEYSNTPTENGTIWSDTLDYNETHLIVVKITPNTDKNTEDIESAELFLDPDLTKTEEDNADAIIVSVKGKGIGSIRGINIVQKKNVTGKVAGLRFSDNWADVAKAAENNDTPSALNQATTNNTNAKKVMIDGNLYIMLNGELYTISGTKL